MKISFKKPQDKTVSEAEQEHQPLQENKPAPRDWKMMIERYMTPKTAGGAAMAAAVIAAILCGIYIPEASSAIELPSSKHMSEGVVEETTPYQLTNTSITTENVQQVVASLARPKAYSATVTNTLHWGGTWDDIDATQYVRNGITLIAYYNAENVQERYEVVEDDVYYSWRRDGTAQYSASTGSLNSDDMSMIPTYENVIALNQNDIVDAGVRTVNGESCIFVTVNDTQNGYEVTYWISTVSGLLIQADYTRDGQLARSVVVSDIVREIPAAALYVLPDGTSLLPDVTEEASSSEPAANTAVSEQTDTVSDRSTQPTA